MPQNKKIIEQLGRIQIAYGILSNPEKRKRYDSDLANQRAEELLQKVQITEEEPEVFQSGTEEEKIKQTILEQINQVADSYEVEKIRQEKQQKLAEKQAKKDFRKAKREAKKRQQRKREMEIQAYGRFLEKQGYQVKYPWTWLRVKRLMISLLVILISLVILWQIPFVKNAGINLYHQNFIVKWMVDTIKWW